MAHSIVSYHHGVSFAAAIGLVLALAGSATAQTQQANERQAGRDVNQAAKQEARSTKIDCRQENNKSNAECRQDKRQDKQEGRDESRDVRSGDTPNSDNDSNNNN